MLVAMFPVSPGEFLGWVNALLVVVCSALLCYAVGLVQYERAILQEIKTCYL